MMMPLWMLLLLIFGYGQQARNNSEKSPPKINVLKTWIVENTTPIGNVIVRVLAVSDEANDNGDILFGLKKIINSFSDHDNDNDHDHDHEPLPFTIHEKYGHVWTNQSLFAMAGRNMVILVTARYVGSSLAANEEVWVKIVRGTYKTGLTKLAAFSKRPGMPNFLDQPPKAVAKPSPKPNWSNRIIFPANQKIIGLSDEEMVFKSIYKDEVESPSDEDVTNSKTLTTTEKRLMELNFNSKQEASRKINILLLSLIIIISSLVISAVIAFMLLHYILRKQKPKINKGDMKKSTSSTPLIKEMVHRSDEQTQSQNLLNLLKSEENLTKLKDLRKRRNAYYRQRMNYHKKIQEAFG